MSIYLWDSEGLTPRNRELLEQAGEFAKKFGGPWLLAGDFNMPPETLENEAACWLGAAGAVIVKPEGLTCRSAGGGRVIDY